MKRCCGPRCGRGLRPAHPLRRRAGRLHIDNLRRLGVVMKRAQYFLTASGKIAEGLRFTQDTLLRSLIAAERPLLPQAPMEQLSLFDSAV